MCPRQGGKAWQLLEGDSATPAKATAAILYPVLRSGIRWEAHFLLLDIQRADIARLRPSQQVSSPSWDRTVTAAFWLNAGKPPSPALPLGFEYSILAVAPWQFRQASEQHLSNSSCSAGEKRLVVLL